MATKKSSRAERRAYSDAFGTCNWGIAAAIGLSRSIMCADATSASGPACSRRAPPGVQRQRNASRHEA